MRDRGTTVHVEILEEGPSYGLRELARVSGVRVELIVEMVEHGILQPHGARPGDWRFPAAHIARVRRALRLRRDLELNWAGVGLAGELLDELEDLRRRHRALLRRLR
jgi:chaperone modulatory protein CbpM